MIAKRNGLKEELERVMEEILKSVDFDAEVLAEASPSEVEAIIFDAVLSVIDQEEVPFIDWVRMVQKEEAEEFMDEGGGFIPN